MPNTAPMPSAATMLTISADPARLRAELDELHSQAWLLQSSYRNGAVTDPAAIDWHCVPLRSAGGSANRTDPGGPGLLEFEDTHWRQVLIHASRLVDEIPGPKRAVRYLALGTGAASYVHTDGKCGPFWGAARIHIPVITNDAAALLLDGAEYHWQPGEVWFGDFSREHQVANFGHDVRVHLVVDVLVTTELKNVFPGSWAEYFERGDVLYNRPLEPRPGRAEEWACGIGLPVEFVGRPGEPTSDDCSGEVIPARVRPLPDDGLLLEIQSGQRYRLVHVTGGEFRLAGWCDERTIVLPASGSAPTAFLRAGRSVMTFPIAA